MIHLKPGTRVFVSCRPTDMRKGFNGLSALIANELQPILTAGICSCSGASAAII